MNSRHILITGGSGMIGSRLTALLLQKGYQVSHLGRTRHDGKVKTFLWDIDQNHIEEGALDDVDVIIHLAGANVGDGRWTKERKQEILDSRVKSAALLINHLKKSSHKVSAFISASGISYYGLHTGDRVCREDDEPGDDFLAEVTKKWEAAADKAALLGLRVVKLRTGVVLTAEGGALQKMAQPVKWFVGAPLGSGDQYISWMHLDDICALYCKVIEDETMQGPYNAVTAAYTTNRGLTKAIARTLDRPLFLPPVPAFALKMVFGEMASIVLKGSIISAEKIQRTGFQFKFPTLEEALNDIYKKVEG